MVARMRVRDTVEKGQGARLAIFGETGPIFGSGQSGC